MKRLRLGVNIDHVATLRQARGTAYPDPVHAAFIAESAGADQITVHLREDRRHIQDRDLDILRKTIVTGLNLEMAATDEMVSIALRVKPDMVTFVPEKREELTTEGGLDVEGGLVRLAEASRSLKEAGIAVSMFIDPDEKQVYASRDAGAGIIELHTGKWCDLECSKARSEELLRLKQAARIGKEAALSVSAGHGLNYCNVREIAAIEEIEELNIGHAIVARAVFFGFDAAVREMIKLMER